MLPAKWTRGALRPASRALLIVGVTVAVLVSLRDVRLRPGRAAGPRCRCCPRARWDEPSQATASGLFSVPFTQLAPPRLWPVSRRVLLGCSL